jgi:hypothetical protein
VWILEWLPHWIFYFAIIIGIAGVVVSLFLQFTPIVYLYKTPIQIFSIILIAIVTYMSGAISNEELWQARVKELEIKVAQAETNAAKENVKIVEKIVYKNKIIKEKGTEIIQYIDREVVNNQEVVKFTENCVIPKEIINVHNNSITELSDTGKGK